MYLGEIVLSSIQVGMKRKFVMMMMKAQCEKRVCEDDEGTI